MKTKNRRRYFYFFGMSNCFFFGFYMWVTRGGYFAVRRSKHITGWHWVWIPATKKFRIVHYEPISPKAEWYKAAFHKVLYKGKILRNDNKFLEEIPDRSSMERTGVF